MAKLKAVFEFSDDVENMGDRDDFFEFVAEMLEECAEQWRDGSKWEPVRSLEANGIKASWRFTEEEQA